MGSAARLGSKSWNRRRLELIARGAFRLCLMICPPDFRLRFGTPLVETFQDQIDQSYRRAGWPGWTRQVAVECWSLLLNGIRQQAHLWRRSNIRSGSTLPEGSASSPSGGNPLGNLAYDLRSAIRTLRRHPGFSAGIILLLTFGIGLNTMLFSLLNVYLLRPLPYPGGDRLMTVRQLPIELPEDAPRTLRETIPEGLSDIDWAVPSELAEETVSWDLDAFTLLDEGKPEVLLGAWVTPGYLRALGARPGLGRILDDSDGQPGAPPVAVLGHDL